MKKFIIIDGNAIIHRAYHAIPPLTDKKGRLVNAVYGFASMLLKVWNQLRPEYLAVSFDLAGPTFRHVKYKEYKATRVKADQDLYDQIPLVHELVQAFNIPIFEKKGYEADDIIGTLARQIKDKEIYIVTGDMDTLQLVNKDVKVYTLRQGMNDVVIYDADKVRQRYEFGPEMVVDYKALRGDGSDNIIGVPGIGEKTATQLITKIGGIEEIYHQLKDKNSKLYDEFKPGVIAKLIAGQDSAVLSKELATIDRAVPDLGFDLAKCALKDFDKDKVLKIFAEFEFVSLLKRIPGMGNEAWPVEKKKIKNKTGLKFEIKEVGSEKEITELIKIIKNKKVFSAKEVVSGVSIMQGKLQGLVMVVDGRGYWVEKKYLEKIKKILTDKEIELIGHDLKNFIKALKNDGVVKQFDCVLFDTKIASYLLNPGNRAHDPASIALKILGKELPAGSGQESLFGVDYRSLAQELYFLQQASDKLKKELKQVNNLGLLEKIEMPLLGILADMEINGMAVDYKMLKELSLKVNKDIVTTTRKIHELAKEEFNISSTTQLREILFDKLELPTAGIKKGKTGYSTDSEQLGKLAGVHPIIAQIEIYRELSKLQNTYIDVLPSLVNKNTGRIHTSFNQAITATGRLSSSEPNLQNIPIRTEIGRQIRNAFMAQSGHVLVSADYSQIELRIVASLAKDEKLIDIFTRDKDVHAATAAAINGVPLDKVSKEMRYAAKEVNFGVLYGMGSYGLSWRAGIPVWQAKEFIAKYFEQFEGVKKYIDQILVFARQEGYSETLFGRRRYLPELNSRNFQARSTAERMAINHPIQGTAADLMKMAMIMVGKKIDKLSHPAGEVKMIMQVHDELVLEVKKGLEKEAGELVKKTMEEVVKLNVPVKVDVHSGPRWGELK
ncbi:MAG: DNA polymerase I [Candidatus Magasanikbacteria bacterium CG10_big_fil_rev_8_21_14_0_10_40_10]|uniref:DNA polymerase I n=1 Tax=Candidatus Magasanikbacteria bacterium CG10_big_fil_rev_8_21_14_0_10_40_10 TaxID=1974648 RepID=A0A2M6W3C9_9BACT|nr:MAG: DNA polymerase I [Candidatus Magasanikbacteria bacterium CG10_big_fil_rev_8_21_14_0_10_40_10]